MLGSIISSFVNLVPVPILLSSGTQVVANCVVMGHPGCPATVVAPDPAVLFRSMDQTYYGCASDFRTPVDRVILTSLSSVTDPPRPGGESLFLTPTLTRNVRIRVPEVAVHGAEYSSRPNWMDPIRRHCGAERIRIVPREEGYSLGDLSSSPYSLRLAPTRSDVGGLLEMTAAAMVQLYVREDYGGPRLGRFLLFRDPSARAPSGSEFTPVPPYGPE